MTSNDSIFITCDEIINFCTQIAQGSTNNESLTEQISNLTNALESASKTFENQMDEHQDDTLLYEHISSEVKGGIMMVYELAKVVQTNSKDSTELQRMIEKLTNKLKNIQEIYQKVGQRQIIRDLFKKSFSISEEIMNKVQQEKTIPINEFHEFNDTTEVFQRTIETLISSETRMKLQCVIYTFIDSTKELMENHTSKNNKDFAKKLLVVNDCYKKFQKKLSDLYHVLLPNVDQELIDDQPPDDVEEKKDHPSFLSLIEQIESLLKDSNRIDYELYHQIQLQINESLQRETCFQLEQFQIRIVELKNLIRKLQSSKFDFQRLISILNEHLVKTQNEAKTLYCNSDIPVQDSFWPLFDRILNLPSLEADHFSSAIAFLKEKLPSADSSNYIVITLANLFGKLHPPSHFFLDQTTDIEDAKIIQKIEALSEGLSKLIQRISNTEGLITIFQASIHTIYHCYRRFISEFSAASDQQKEEMKIIKAQLSGAGLGYFVLNKTIALNLLSKDISGKGYKKNQLGTHSVYLEEGVYYKPNPEGRHYIGPEMEFAIYSFYQILGCSDAVAPTALIKIRDIIFDNKQYYQRALQAGYAVEGISLQDLLGMCDVVTFLTRITKNQNETETFFLFSKIMNTNWEEQFIQKNPNFSSDLLSKLSIDEIVNLFIEEFERFFSTYPVERRPLEFTDLPVGNRTKHDFYSHLGNYSFKRVRNVLALLHFLPDLTVIRDGDIVRPVSLTVELTDLCHYIQKIKSFFPKLTIEKIFDELRQLRNRFDPANFTTHFVVTLLTNPYDHKTDNLIVKYKRNDIGSIEALSLVGIDNDLAFTPNPESVRTIIYLMDTMDTPFNQSVRDKLFETSPELLIMDWLVALDEQNQRYLRWQSQGTLTDEDLFEYGEVSLNIPLKIDSQLIPNLYSKALKLYQILKEKKSSTHWEILFGIEEQLAAVYQKAKTSSPNLEIAYSKVPHLFAERENDKGYAAYKKSEKEAQKQYPSEAALNFLKQLDITSFPLKVQVSLIGKALQQFPSSISHLKLPGDPKTPKSRADFFLLAVKQGHKALVARLLEEEWKSTLENAISYSLVEFRTQEEQTGFLIACVKLDLEMIRLLIHYGSDQQVVDIGGRNAISICLRKFSLFPLQVSAIVRFLVNNSAVLLNLGTTNSGWAALHTLVMQSSSYAEEADALLAFLVTKGANPDLVDSNGRTPLDYAIENNFERVVKQLIHFGAGRVINVNDAIAYFSSRPHLKDTYSTLISQSLILRWHLSLNTLKNLCVLKNNESSKFRAKYHSNDALETSSNNSKFQFTRHSSAGNRPRVIIGSKSNDNTDNNKNNSSQSNNDNNNSNNNIPSNENQNVDNKKNTAILQGPNIGTIYLPSNITKQILNDTGDINSQIAYGRRNVCKIQLPSNEILFFKQYPEMPGVEYAINMLFMLLIGHGTSFTELTKLTPPSNSRSKSFPVLISQGIHGDNFHDVLTDPEKSKILEQMDHLSFSELLLASLLVNFEDAKPDNFILEKMQNNSYRLIGIDNDHAFVPPLVKEEGKTILVKCILYSLEMMKIPLHHSACERFLSFNVERILQQWLVLLQEQNQKFSNLFSESERKDLFKQTKKNQGMIITIPFKSGSITDIYQKFKRLQSALQETPKITGIEILRVVIPSLGIRYEEAFRKFSAPLDRFLSLTRTQYSIAIAGRCETLINSRQLLKSMNIPEKSTWKDSQDLGPSLALQELNYLKQEIQVTAHELRKIRDEIQLGNLQRFEQLHLDISREKVINGIKGEFEGIDFKSIGGKGISLSNNNMKLQRLVLQTITSNNYRSLKIVSSSVFEKSALARISRYSPQLVHLELNNCSNVDGETISILNTSKYLASLKLINLKNIGAVILSLRTLRKLQIKKCQSLASITFNTTLKSLTVDSCVNLRSINTLKHLGSNFLLESLNLSSCANLKPWWEIFNTWFSSSRSNELHLLNVPVNPNSKNIGLVVKAVLQRPIDERNQLITSLHKYYKDKIWMMISFLVNLHSSPSDKLERLELTKFKYLSDSWLEVIVGLTPKLTDLNLSGCEYITNTGLKYLSLLTPHLKSLNLMGCWEITDKGLVYLGIGCPMIKTINLWDCEKITDSGLRTIAYWYPNLTSINLGKCSKISDNGVRSLCRGCSALSSLILRYCERLTIKGIQFIANNCKNLQSIDLRDVRNWGKGDIKNNGFQLLVGSTPLKKIKLSSHLIDDEGLTYFLNSNTHHNITSFNFKGLNCSDKGLISFMQQSTQPITKITLKSMHYTTPRTISKFIDIRSSLLHLSIRDIQIIEIETLDAIATMNNLLVLDLYDSRMLIAGSVDKKFRQSLENVFTKCTTLTSISMNVSVNDKLIECLATHCPNLTSISDFFSQSLTNSAVKTLSGNCKNLKKIWLDRFTSMSNDSLMYLASNSPSLTSLVISGSINDSGVKILVNTCTQLEKVMFSSKYITEKAMLLISRKCPNLMYLHCDGECKPFSKDIIKKIKSQHPRISITILNIIENQNRVDEILNIV